MLGSRYEALLQRTVRFPCGTAILAGVAVIAALVPAFSSHLIDLREATGSEPWRFFTSHLVHGNVTHLLLNLAFFVVLGVLRERRVGTARFLLEYAVLAACVAVGVRVLHSGSEWSSYCGLSGIVYGTLALVLLDGRSPNATGKIKGKMSAVGLGPWIVACVSVKTALELAGGGWVLGRNVLENSFGVLYLAGSHAAGIAGGVLLAAAYRQARAASQPRRNALTPTPASATSRRDPIIAAPAAPERLSLPACPGVRPPRA